MELNCHELSTSLKSIQELYDKDKICEAYKMMQDTINLNEIDIEDYPILCKVNNDYEETRQILREFEDKADWITEKEGPIHVSYKKVSGTPTISLMCESILEVPLFNFITLIYETDLYHSWVPFCKRSETIERISKSRKIIYSEFDVIKIAKRASCLYGYGLNMLNTDGVVMVIARSVENVHVPSNMTMAKVNFFGCLIHPLSESSIHVKFISNFDPNLRFLPYSLLNWAVRKISSLMFSKLVEKTKNFNQSEYPERMKLEENIEFYKHLEESFQEYLENLNKIKN